MAAWSTAAGTMMAAGNAQAASEVAQLAAGDNRVGIIATLALPAVGWVAFNIAGPALNQLANMDDANKMRYYHVVHTPPKCTKPACTVSLTLLWLCHVHAEDMSAFQSSRDSCYF